MSEGLPTPNTTCDSLYPGRTGYPKGSLGSPPENSDFYRRIEGSLRCSKSLVPSDSQSLTLTVSSFLGSLKIGRTGYLRIHGYIPALCRVCFSIHKRYGFLSFGPFSEQGRSAGNLNWSILKTAERFRISFSERFGALFWIDSVGFFILLCLAFVIVSSHGGSERKTGVFYANASSPTVNGAFS